jgi:acetyltransferase
MTKSLQRKAITTIRRIASQESPLAGGLCDLLIDVVGHGSSVGFLWPLTPDTARQYWEKAMAGLGASHAMWVAEEGGEVVGTVQLALCEKDNGRHRAEVQKLVVRSSHRGQGIASTLMKELEQFARADGRTLLVLDTEAGSAAESVYQHLGWQRGGKIPNYAASPDGKLQATCYYYKALAKGDR